MRIYEHAKADISANIITAGTRLPASRALATDLGVSRATVVTAYDQLVAEGYAEARPGSGIYVSDTGPVIGINCAPVDPDPTATSKDQNLPLQPNSPDDTYFPLKSWAKSVAKTARTNPTTLFQSAGPLGDIELRRQIVRHLSEWRGVSAKAEQIVITAGSGEALEMAIRLTCQSGDRIGLENPGYGPTRNFANELGLQPHWLKIGPGGAKLPGSSAPDLRATVLTPSHQFPLGGTMPSGRRKAFIARANINSSWIIEDDFDSEFRYSGRPVPAMAGLDNTGHTIYVGGFSKLFSVGIRLGYLAVPLRLLEAVQMLLNTCPSHASVVGQRPLANFMADGKYHRHLRRVRRVYARRYEILLNALDTNFSDIGHFERHNTGMHLALHLPTNIKDTELAKETKSVQLGCRPLSDFCSGEIGVNGMLLGFCATPDTDIPIAVRNLRSVIANF